MGRLIEQLAPEYGFQVVLKLDEFNNMDGSGLTAANFQGVDVAIEFSTPAVVPGNASELDALCDAGVLGFKCFLAPSGVDEFAAVAEADLRVALPVLRRAIAPGWVEGADLGCHLEAPITR